MPKPKPPDQELAPPVLPAQAPAPVDLSEEQTMSEANQEQQPPAKPKRWKVREGCTVYVRNMKFEAGAILPCLSDAEVAEFGQQNVIE